MGMWRRKKKRCLLPTLGNVSDRLEDGGVGHAPIASVELDDLDDEDLGRHGDYAGQTKGRGRENAKKTRFESLCK
jgi:hypothetical protein